MTQLTSPDPRWHQSRDRYSCLSRLGQAYDSFGNEARNSMTQGVAYLTLCMAFEGAIASAVMALFALRPNPETMPLESRLIGTTLLFLASLVPFLTSLALLRVERRYLIARRKQELLEDAASGQLPNWPKSAARPDEDRSGTQFSSA